MSEYHIFLILIVIGSIGWNLLMKTVSNRVSVDATPIFMGVWAVLMLFLYALFIDADVLIEGWKQLRAIPSILFLALLKGWLFWDLFMRVQELRQQSSSITAFGGPLIVAGSMVCNSFFGENLDMPEVISGIGIFIVGLLFFKKGYGRDLTRETRDLFMRVLGLATVCAVIDHIVVSAVGWGGLAIVSFAVLLGLMALRIRSKPIWREALLNPYAIMGGSTFALFEITKYYALVRIIPVTVVLIISAVAVPIIMILSSIIWKENRWQDQLLWGGLAALCFIPLILG